MSRTLATLFVVGLAAALAVAIGGCGSQVADTACCSVRPPRR